MRSTMLRCSILCASVLLSLVSACGGASSSSSRTSTPSTTESRTELRDDPHLDALRPPGSAPLLAAIEARPNDADAYATAAAAYVDTRVSGMTLFWGQTYRLLAPHGPRSAEVATLMRRAIETHIDVSPNDTITGWHFAPGNVPVLAEPGGELMVPFAHRYELVLGTALVSRYRGQGTLDEVAPAFAHYPELALAGGPLPYPSDSDLARYLRVLGAAVGLDTYARWVIGSAYPDDWSRFTSEHGTDIERLEAYLRDHPFVPTTGVRPDDLVDVRR